MRSFCVTLLFALCHQASLCAADDHICDSTSACPATIDCKPQEPCSVTCSGADSCQSRVINCPPFLPCHVQCIDPTDKRLCLELVINARDSPYLSVEVSSGDSSVTKIMNSAKIYCPDHGPAALGRPCNIRCDGDDLLAKTEIFAVGGFDDVDITAAPLTTDFCYREGVMHCGDDLSSSCAMTDDSDGNTLSPTFQCLPEAVDKTCNALSTTSTSQTPSTSPSMSPTPAPTAQATSNPTTYAPTQKPTPEPTITRLTANPARRRRTAEPTSYPTSRVTAYPSIAPSAGSTTTSSSAQTNASEHDNSNDYNVTQTISMTSTHYNPRPAQSESEYGSQSSLSMAEEIGVVIGGIILGACIFACCCLCGLRAWCMGCCERDTRKTSRTKTKQNVPRVQSAQPPPMRSLFKVSSIRMWMNPAYNGARDHKLEVEPTDVEAADDLGALSELSESEVSKVSSKGQYTTSSSSDDDETNLESGDVTTELSVCVPKSAPNKQFRAFRNRVPEDSVSQSHHTALQWAEESRPAGKQFKDGHDFAEHMQEMRSRANCEIR